MSLASASFRLGPAILGAGSFACADVLAKVTLNSGFDVLTAVTVRGYVGLGLLFAWLKVAPPRRPMTPRTRWLSLGLGLLFTGNMFGLFKAFELIEVPVAILTYFVYPLLTGLAAAATGLEVLTWRGVAAAATAFAGLAVMLGAHPGGLAALGVVAALGSACCRVMMLLVTRAALQQADARVITWHSFVSSTVLFTAILLASGSWQAPSAVPGWVALVALSAATTLGVFSVYLSTVRIGPFRTALFMNLEPPLTALGSAIFLGETLNALQLLGGAVMLAALVAFQIRR